ncbi:amidohydrolase family protein [Bradyrhizobium valentinum]|uniref:amidohydrolase family protein n=1 Tax=Bradyrhizobium valentinum TaxID=1518501 RepID=UPI0007102E4D|nr:amidohydrolase family protein [Bradyrhizobium valentinum]KRR02338.1 aminocarboxymuconate-semialdehyde decarboxylase [Bradyrhizobium valentinum]
MSVISRCGCGIDVHAHVVPASFPHYMGSAVPSDWPSMADAKSCHKHVMMAGRVYRTVSDRCWDVEKRISDMEEMGLGVQAISPMPELLSYWMEPGPADDLLRYINDQIAEMVTHSCGRLVGLGAIPLQDIDRAIVELRRLKHELGFAGVEIGSNVNGKPIGSPHFDALFAEVEGLDMAVFVHALRPCGMDRLVGPSQLQQVLAYPTDIGLAAASVITSNLLLHRPGLRIAFSHGGGTLGLLLPRLQEGFQVFPALQESVLESPILQARRLYYDALVYDGPTLLHLISKFGETQIMLGTDYPFAFHDRTPVARAVSAISNEAAHKLVVRDNAKRFLGLGEHAPQ